MKHPFLSLVALCCVVGSSALLFKMQSLKSEVHSLNARKGKLEAFHQKSLQPDSSAIVSKLPTKFAAKLEQFEVTPPDNLKQLCTDSDYVILTETIIRDAKPQQIIREIYQINNDVICSQLKGNIIEKAYHSTTLFPNMYEGEIHFYKAHKDIYTSYIYMGRTVSWNGLPIATIQQFLKPSE